MGRPTSSPVPADLTALAKAKGIAVTYTDGTGSRRKVSVDTLEACLGALGVEASDPSARAAALVDHHRQQEERSLPEVLVAWPRRVIKIPVRLPDVMCLGRLHGVLATESGLDLNLTFSLDEARRVGTAVVDGVPMLDIELPIPGPLTPGYHRLSLDLPQVRQNTLVISAPSRCMSFPAPGERAWGLFAPTYALRPTPESPGGHLGALRTMGEWVADHGGRVLATLPLMAGFFDELFNHYPYSPASRLFFDEIYLDIPALPEFQSSPKAQALASTVEFRHRVAAMAAADRVDHRGWVRQQRLVLSVLADEFLSRPSPRRSAFEAACARHPDLEDYGRFRAVAERYRQPWFRWPASVRAGRPGPDDFVLAVARRHTYAAWATGVQLADVSEALDKRGVGLYLDLPVGVNPDAYDVWAHRNSYVSGMGFGAPPDPLCQQGQNWGLVPLHPTGLRHKNYAHFRAILGTVMSVAGIVRLDHVMALHRLFWIPPGRSASDGTYVTYPADELYAVLCLESHRHSCGLVGENLGTVPPAVNKAMARHRVRRMSVVQYRLEDAATRRAQPDFAPPDRDTVAMVNTHDMPPLAAFWTGRDLTERHELGAFSREIYENARVHRRDACRRLAVHLEGKGLLPAGASARPEDLDPATILDAVLDDLADSPADLLLLNVEDLWLEMLSQNAPGVPGHPDFQRRLRHGHDALIAHPEVQRRLARVIERRPSGDQILALARQR